MIGCHHGLDISGPELSKLWELVMDKALESPLDSTEIKPVNPKGNQP